MKNNSFFTLNIHDTIKLLTQKLATVSDTPRLESELLIANVLQTTRTWLFTYPEQALTATQQQQLWNDLERRLRGEPMAYILGYQEFWGLKLKVDANVLIPRPETEHLIEWILAHCEHSPLRVADLGTGSGAIAIALASERPEWSIDATDHSPTALAIAQQNAANHQVKNVHFYLGNWCDALPPKQYDLIVSNPPYIADQDPHLSALIYEPRSALSAGVDGLNAIRTIIEQAPDFLAENGYLILEHGYDQAAMVTKLLQHQHFTDIQIHTDLAHHPRFATARKVAV